VKKYINTIIPGRATSPNVFMKGQFQDSIAIDPDMPEGDSDYGNSGIIRPTQMSKISGTEITGVPLWMERSTENLFCYAYANDGKVHVVTHVPAMSTPLNSGTALTNAHGNGMAYTKGVLIIAKDTDYAHYDIGAGTLTQAWWTTQSLTAPVNKTYPSINGVAIPNHMCHRHLGEDDEVYVCNVLSTNCGSLDRIRLADDGTDSDSAANVQEFPLYWWPVTIESYDGQILIALIECSGTTARALPAKVAIWDTYSEFYSDASWNFDDPLITAMKRLADGTILIFSGPRNGGCRIVQMFGIGSFKQIAYLPDAHPPFQGAVDKMFDRVIFGTGITQLSTAGVVYSIGSTSPEMGRQMGMHCILKATTAGTVPQITALKYHEFSATKIQPLVGWKDGTPAYGIDALATTASSAIVVKFFSDVETSGVTIGTVNNTNNPGEKEIEYCINDCRGNQECYLQFEYSNGAKFKTEKIIMPDNFALNYLRFKLNAAVGATFVGSIRLPIELDLSVE
jgi:hypothetical protein